MNPTSELALRTALASAIAATLESLRRHFGPRGLPLRDRTSLSLTSATDEETGSVSIGLRPDAARVVDLDQVIVPIHGVIDSLLEVEQLRLVLEEDVTLHPLISAYTGEFIDGPREQIRFMTRWLLLPFMRYYLDLHPADTWNEATFDAIFPDVVRQVDGDSLPIELLAPLENFRSDLERVDLDDGQTSIVGLTDDDRSAIWDEFGPRDMFGPGITVENMFEWTHAIKHSTIHRLPSDLGDSPPPEGQPIDDLVTVLRLLRESSVARTFTWRRHKRYSFAQASHESLSSGAHGSTPRFSGRELTLTQEDVPILEQSFSRIRAVDEEESDASRRLSLALRRLDASAMRDTVEDRLIDYWVALEALFLSDSKESIRHRAGTRIARFLETDLDARRKLARMIKSSYDRRSGIVHGDQLRADLPEVTDATGEVLRQALKDLLNESRVIDLESLDLS